MAGTLLWNEPAHAVEWLIYITLHFSEVSLWENSACFAVTNLNDQQYLICYQHITTWAKSLFNFLFVSFFLLFCFVFLFCFVLFWWWCCCCCSSLSGSWGSDIPWLIPSYLAVGELGSQALTSHFRGALLICRSGEQVFSFPSCAHNWPGCRISMWMEGEMELISVCCSLLTVD